METVYFTTHSYIRREGNVLDLADYRRRLAGRGEEAPAPAPRPRRREGRSRGGWALWALDACASLGVLALTVTFALRALSLA